MKNKTLLLVEDDMELAMMVQQYLTTEGFVVHWVDNGLKALDVIEEIQPDLILLDIMLPGLNGIEVCRRIRPGYSKAILMLTAKDDDMVEVTSLNLGANGYLKKPVRPHVLLAHIHAQLRGDIEHQKPDRTVVKDLSVDKGSLCAKIGDTDLLLTNAEFNLLSFICERVGQVVTRDELYENLRGIPFDGLDRAIDMQISVLRRKMNDEYPPYKYIKTVRTKGYMLAAR